MLTQNDDNEFQCVYKNNKYFQNYYKTKYNLTDDHILLDDNLILLIYACEWFKIPDEDKFDKVCYHPYLTKKDNRKLTQIYQHYTNLFIYECVGLLGVAFLIRRKMIRPYNIRKRGLKTLGLFLGVGMVAFLSWKFIFMRRLNQRIRKDKDLEKYSTLNLDRNKIKEDLLNYNIVIKF